MSVKSKGQALRGETDAQMLRKQKQ